MSDTVQTILAPGVCSPSSRNENPVHASPAT